MKYVEIDFDRAVELYRQGKEDKVFVKRNNGELEILTSLSGTFGMFVMRSRYFEQKESTERQLVHLCNDCEYECIAACPITKNVKFGNGQGNDNVIECENYINKEALKKWQINKIITGGLNDENNTGLRSRQ